MGVPRKPFCKFLQFFLFILAIFNLTPHSQSAATDYTTLVYKGCAEQTLSDAHSQALSSLLSTLLSQSSKSKFFKTTSNTSQTTITGLFQCRGDLSNVDCYNCVSQLSIRIEKLCGKVKAIAARIQLLGCYMMYEGAGFAQISGMHLLYKRCSRNTANGAGFEEKRDTALNALGNGMSSGFFTATSGRVYVLGQCEGDVGASDCVECVKNASQIAQVECGSSIGGQIYLHKCFIGYNSYYFNGVPDRSSPSGAGPNTEKTVAIIVGGAAGVGFFVICLLCARGLMKKKDDY